VRGLNNTESISTFDPPVGSYIDDAFIQRQNANNFTLFDVERVEVLRGPQGTLFGRNTTGGAVRVILKDPAEELGGFIEGGFGEYDEINFRGSVDVPLSDRVRTKFSGYYVSDDGYVDVTGPGNGDLNYEDSFGLRAAIQVDIRDDISWDGSVAFNDNEHANVFNAQVGGDRVSNSGLQDGGLAGVFTGPKANLPGNFNNTESTLISSDFGIETRAGTINFITNYITLDQEFSLDFFDTPAPVGGFTINNIGSHDQFTQEIRLTGDSGNVDYVAGIFYFDEENETDFADQFFIGFPLVLADRILTNDTKSLAIYGQADVHATDQLTFTVGARYTDENKIIGYSDNTGGALNTASIQALGIATQQDANKITPRFAVNYDFNDDVSVYGSWTQGFKSGGWNARGTSPDQIIPFGPESADALEIGLKSQWGDSLRLNIAAFQTDVSDFQLPSAFVTATGAIAFITQNFADLDVEGVEAEITYQPIDGLTLFANLGFQDSEYSALDDSVLAQQADCQATGNACGQGVVTADGSIATPVRAPETTVTVGASYEFNFANGLTLSPSIVYSDIGDHAIGTANAVGDGISYDQLNAGITLAGPDKKWSVAASCTNCTDEAQEVSNLAGFIYLNEPVRWNIRARYNF